MAVPGRPQHLVLLIGEIKEIVPARYGFKSIVKHMPDQAFAIDEQLYRRLGRRFEPELALWGASDDIHMVMIATFGVSSAGVPAIHEQNRSFVKGLHYNLGRGEPIASAVLTDCEGPAPMLFILPASLDEAAPVHETGDTGAPAWKWRRSGEPLPPIPRPRPRTHRPDSAWAGSTPLTAGAECPQNALLANK